MKSILVVLVFLSILLAACGAPRSELPAAASLPTQISIPATVTAVPPIETSLSNAKLPAAPFDAEIYVNQETGFALDYPTGWTVNETIVGPRGTQILFLSRPELAEAASIPEGETRLSATIYQWDQKNDLAAYVQHMKDAWTPSGSMILEEQELTLELGLPAVLFTVQTAEAPVVFLVTALHDQYLVIGGEGDLGLVRQIVERVRPIS